MNCIHCDVFTDRPFGGNHWRSFPDAAGATDRGAARLEHARAHVRARDGHNGRSCLLDVQAERDPARITAVRVGGESVFMGSGVIY